MAAAKEKTLDELLLEREAIDSEREKLSEQIQQKSSAGLVDVLNEAVTMIDELESVGLSKEAKKLIRQISRSVGVSTAPKSAASGMSREEKNNKKAAVVAEFLKDLKDRTTFTIPELDTFARKAGEGYSGSAEQYFKSQLATVAKKTKNKKGRVIEWEKVQAKNPE